MQNVTNIAPRWIKLTLIAAGIYNLAWGTLTIVMPELYFNLSKMPLSNYPEIWQCVGMIVGVYGIGYIIAAYAPYKHWPIILVGLLGKVLGPFGFINAYYKGTFTLAAGLTNITNDLIWWIPFTIILVKAYRYYHPKEIGTNRN
jgi:small multidrug resistance pump